MISAEIISRYFGINHRVITLQIDSLTHEDSLLQPACRGNCLNWVLGHIVATRNSALALLNEEPIWDEDQAGLYVSGSHPVTSAQDPHRRFEKIVEDLNRSQEKIMAALERVSQVQLDTKAGDGTVGEALAGLFWHEAYHTGQTEYLRQLAGINDAVI